MDTGRNRLFGIIAALCFWPTAGQAEEIYSMMGAGSASCGEFASRYKESPDSAEILYYSWAQGYLSATNLVAIGQGREFRNLRSISSERQRAYIRSYCNKNPLANYIDAVNELYKSLEVPEIAKTSN